MIVHEAYSSKYKESACKWKGVTPATYANASRLELVGNRQYNRERIAHSYLLSPMYLSAPQDLPSDETFMSGHSF